MGLSISFYKKVVNSGITIQDNVTIAIVEDCLHVSMCIHTQTLLNAVLPHFLIEAGAVNAKLFGCFGPVVARLPEGV